MYFASIFIDTQKILPIFKLKRNLLMNKQEKLAKECFQNSKFDEALTHFQNILDTNKKHFNSKETANYLNSIGLCYMQLNSYQPALENLQAALGIYERKKCRIILLALPNILVLLISGWETMIRH